MQVQVQVQVQVLSLPPKHSVHLPQLDLGTFDGDVVKWQSFWDKFVAVIDETDMPAVAKFSYLVAALEGEAQQVIRGMAVTEKNYAVVCNLLKERFGRPERIIFAHIQSLLSLKPVTPGQKGKSYISALWHQQDVLLSHIRSLEVLGVKGESCGVFLTPLILSCLPNDIRLEWAREGDGKEADLTFLLSFLQKEIRRLERSESFQAQENTGELHLPEENDYDDNFTASALHVSSCAAPETCLFCDGRHPSHRCRKTSSLKERRARLSSLGLCFRCLCSTHLAKSCTRVCITCKGKHHAVLCYKNVDRTSIPQTNNAHRSPTNAVAASSTSAQESLSGTTLMSAAPLHLHTALPIIEVIIEGPDQKEIKAKLLLDSGSDKTYVSSSLVKKIKPPCVVTDTARYAVFGGHTTPGKVRDVYSLSVRGTRKGVASFTGAEVHTVCAPMYRPSVPASKLSLFTEVELVDTGIKDAEELSIDILIGVDQYWKFVRSGVIRGTDGLVAQETIFGWMVTGSWLK